MAKKRETVEAFSKYSSFFAGRENEKEKQRDGEGEREGGREGERERGRDNPRTGTKYRPVKRANVRPYARRRVVYADGTHGVLVHKCVAKSVRAEHVFLAANALPAPRKKVFFSRRS